MPGGSTPELGNTAYSQAIITSLTPPATLTTNNSVTSTYTVNGLILGNVVVLVPQAAVQALLTVGAVWVSAANTLSVQWINSTSASSSGTPTAITCVLYIVQPTFLSYPVTTANVNWPTALE